MKVEKFKQNLVNNILLQSGGWGQAVQLIIYEANKGNFEFVSILVTGKQGDVSCKSFGEGWFFAVSPFPEHKALGIS